jgi:N-methylhydantoinase B
LLGAQRVRGLCAKYTAGRVLRSSERLFEQTEQRVRASIASWPDGTYVGQTQLHDDAIEGGNAVHIRVSVTIAGDRINFDFRQSDDQVRGPFNIRPPLVRAVCYYCLKCLIDPDLPSNAGLAASVDAEFRPGSLVCPEIPAPVNTYMPVAVATAEAVFDALAGAVPRARIAQSSGGTNGTLSHARTRRGYPQVQYELPAGAIGARATLDGVSASKAHVANGSLTPIEILETEFPIELQRFELVQDSGGPGRQRGGLGYVREYRMLGDSSFATRGGKQLTPAAGREGGLPGRLSRLVVNPGTPTQRIIVARDGNVALKAGDVLRIEQAGGGGYGEPHTRPAESVLDDVREGYVSVAAARDVYGVVILGAERAWRVDESATAQLRTR